jgi:hypothetical protein
MITIVKRRELDRVVIDINDLWFPNVIAIAQRRVNYKSICGVKNRAVGSNALD